MATIREGQLAKIARLMRDPRYWNKKHPEHPQVFADTTRAFENAYPEPPPDSDTTEGTVHVRAYTRVQDGKEIQVSEYDRTQQIAFHGPNLSTFGKSENIQNVAEGWLHKREKMDIARILRSHGFIVETEITLVTKDGVPTRLDLLTKAPWGTFYPIDVKTPFYDDFGKYQRYVIPKLDFDQSVYSTSPRIRSFGYQPGELLPAMCAIGVYATPKWRMPWPLSERPECRPTWFGGK